MTGWRARTRAGVHIRGADAAAGLRVTGGLLALRAGAGIVGRLAGRRLSPGARAVLGGVVTSAAAGAAWVPVAARRRATRERGTRLSAEVARIRRAQAGARDRTDKTRERVARLIQSDGLVVYLQPIFDIDALGRPARGYEALARFPDGRGPHEWFTEAAEAGVATALDAYAFVRAVELLPALPRHAYLSVNLSPETLVSDEFWPAVDVSLAGRVVIELTEHARVGDYEALHRRLDRLREAGLRIAVDDAGAGFSSLSHIVQLGPDVIKLDRELIRGCDTDPVRRTLTEALAGFAHRIGAGVVAEGVETTGELDALRAAGVGQVQGFLLAPPGPAHDVATPALVPSP